MTRFRRAPFRFALPLLLFSLLAAALLPVARAEGFDDVEIRVTHVAGAVYMLEGRGGNIGVSAGEDGILIVDDQFAPLAGKIREALAKLSPGGLQFVLNTHWHGDHTGGNAVFGRDAPIIAHTNVRKRLAAGLQLPERKVEPASPEALPVITFDDSLSIHFNGEEIRALHLPPGHTDGDVIVLFTRSNVVHMGDDFFAGRFPFVDLASGGSVEGLIAGLENLIPRIPEGAKIIPGHGPLSDLEDLQIYLRMLRETRAVVAERVQRGMSLEQIQAAGLPEEWDGWSWEFIPAERWIEILYRDLDGK